MAKPEWGTRRHCQNCGAAFYDLKKNPIVCPKCETMHHPETLLKPKRPRPDEKKAPVPPPPVIAEEPAEAEVAAEDAEEEFLEDAGELGKDEDDVAEVVDPEEPAAEER